MSPELYFYIFALTVPIFFIIDMIWLGLLARPLYQSELKKFLGPVNWPIAILFYLIFIIGLMIFAILPALQAGSVGVAIVYGALFGFFTYATYDLTNLATVRNWPKLITAIDIAWGTVLAMSVATLSYLISNALLF